MFLNKQKLLYKCVMRENCISDHFNLNVNLYRFKYRICEYKINKHKYMYARINFNLICK